MPPKQFKTDRLFIRKPELSDAEILFKAYTSDPDIPYFMTWKVHEDIAKTEKFIKDCLDCWERKNSFAYVITLNDKKEKPFAMIDLWPRGQHEVLFGYVSASKFWGKGYISEALICLVDWALSQENIWRAAAYCDIQNFASARVMEKAGMSFEGIMRKYCLHPNISDTPRDCRMYAKVKKEIQK